MYFKTFVILLLVGFALAKNLKHKKREVLQRQSSTASDTLGSLNSTVQDIIAFLNSIPSQLASGGDPSAIASTLIGKLRPLATDLNAIPILGSLVGFPIQSSISQLEAAIATADNTQISQVLNTLIPYLSGPLGLLSSLLGIYLQI
jgi:hypothetical protein